MRVWTASVAKVIGRGRCRLRPAAVRAGWRGPSCHSALVSMCQGAELVDLFLKSVDFVLLADHYRRCAGGSCCCWAHGSGSQLSA